MPTTTYTIHQTGRRYLTTNPWEAQYASRMGYRVTAVTEGNDG